MICVKEYMESIREQEQRILFKQHNIASYKKEFSSLIKNSRELQASIQATIVEMKKELARMHQEFVLAKQEATRLLEEISLESATILVLRYWEKKTMPEIGKAMFMSERHAYRRLKSAVEEFQAVLDARELSKAS